MKKTKVLILFGGCSPEYEVSLQSAYSVIRNLNSEKYDLILIGITKMGDWFRYYGDIEKIPNDSWHMDTMHCISAVLSPDRNTNKIIEFCNHDYQETKFDIAFPILHGKNGEDGTLQGALELAGIPYVGCNALSSALCMDKDRAHRLVELAGIRTPKGFVLNKATFSKEDMKDKANVLNFPVFVKPVKAGSSFGITKIYKEEELFAATELAFCYDNEIIIEESIEGFEVGCAVLGNHELIVGEVDEIELSEGFFDYVEKYNLIKSEIHMPARVEPEIAERIKKTAVAIYRTLGCSGFARVDMFLTSQKEIVFNEVNTIPGFTIHSRFPNMMRGIGLEFEDLLDKLIETGFER